MRTEKEQWSHRRGLGINLVSGLLNDYGVVKA